VVVGVRGRVEFRQRVPLGAVVCRDMMWRIGVCLIGEPPPCGGVLVDRGALAVHGGTRSRDTLGLWRLDRYIGWRGGGKKLSDQGAACRAPTGSRYA